MPQTQAQAPLGIEFRWHGFDPGTQVLAPQAPPGPMGRMAFELASLYHPSRAGLSEPVDGLSEHVLSNPSSTIGITYDLNNNGEGQCVEYVQAVLSVGHTSRWRAGRKVLETSELAIGTAVMTATADGRYPASHPRHAGIFMGHVDNGQRRGFLILDQWYASTTGTQTAVGQFNNGAPRVLHEFGDGSNNASLYWTIRS